VDIVLSVGISADVKSRHRKSLIEGTNRSDTEAANGVKTRVAAYLFEQRRFTVMGSY
jgi:hypothetical protein